MRKLLIVAGLLGSTIQIVAPSSTMGQANTLGVPIQTKPSISLIGIEATQGIQDADQSVPLITQKKTLVRVYIKPNDQANGLAIGTLLVTQQDGTSTELQSTNKVDFQQIRNATFETLRTSLPYSLDFLLPPKLIEAPGTLRFALKSTTNDQGQTLNCSDCLEGVNWVPFVAGPELKVRVIGLRYAWRNDAGLLVPAEPSKRDFDLFKSWLSRAYPISKLTFSSIVMDADALFPLSCAAANAQVAAVRRLDMDGGQDPSTHYYGMVADDGYYPGWMTGCATTIPATSDPTVVASGPSGNRDILRDYHKPEPDGSYADWYGGHELAHTLGRVHVGACTDLPKDPKYPFPQGQISSPSQAFIGWDAGDSSDPLLRETLMLGTTWHDVMTYCPDEWVSSYTYNILLRRLLAERDPSLAGLSTDIIASADATSGSTAGPQPRIRTDSTFHLIAVVNLTKMTGAIRYVTTSGADTISAQDSSRASLTIHKSSQSPVKTYFAKLKVSTDIAADSDQTAIVEAVLPFDPEATSIDLIVDGKVLATRAISRSAPVLRPGSATTSGVNAPGEYVTLKWTATDNDGNSTIKYAIQISNDGGSKWETVAIGLKTAQYMLKKSLITDSANAFVRVIANDGYKSTSLQWKIDN